MTLNNQLLYSLKYVFLGSGELEFEEFCTLASNFMEEEEDEEAVKRELKQAFKFFDKEGIHNFNT